MGEIVSDMCSSLRSGCALAFVLLAILVGLFACFSPLWWVSSVTVAGTTLEYQYFYGLATHMSNLPASMTGEDNFKFSVNDDCPDASKIMYGNDCDNFYTGRKIGFA